MFYYMSIVAITLLYLNNEIVVEHSVTGPFDTKEKCDLYKAGIEQHFINISEIEVRLSECRTNKPMV